MTRLSHRVLIKADGSAECLHKAGSVVRMQVTLCSTWRVLACDERLGA